ALAVHDAGVEVRVLALHRLVPPRSSFTTGPAGPAKALASLLREPHRQIRDGLPVRYVPYASPPRQRSYASWGLWAAPMLGLALRRLNRAFPFDLIHAHNAVPAGDAVGRVFAAGGAIGLRPLGAPLIVSVHGGDVLYTAPRDDGGSAAVA